MAYVTRVEAKHVTRAAARVVVEGLAEAAAAAVDKGVGRAVAAGAAGQVVGVRADRRRLGAGAGMGVGGRRLRRLAPVRAGGQRPTQVEQLVLTSR